MLDLQIDEITSPNVPNGTKPTKLQDLVERYQAIATKSVADIISLGEIVCEAESTLDGPQLEAFCQRVRLDRKGSSYRKHRMIGKAEAELRPLIDHLPNNWTTLYELARLDPHELKKIAEDPRFGPNMTAAQLQKILSPSNDRNETPFSRDIHIDVTQVGDLPSLFTRLDELVSDLGIDYRCRKKLNKANYRRKPYDFKAVPGGGLRPH